MSATTKTKDERFTIHLHLDETTHAKLVQMCGADFRRKPDFLRLLIAKEWERRNARASKTV